MLVKMVKMVNMVKKVKVLNNYYFSTHNYTMDLLLIHMMLDHTLQRDHNRFHNNTIQFIRFHFIKQNIYIIYMHLNKFKQYIHITKDLILML